MQDLWDRLHKESRILRALREQTVDGDKGIRDDRQTVDQAAAAVVSCALTCGVTQINSAFSAAHKGRQKRYAQVGQRNAGAVGRTRHEIGIMRCVLIKCFTDAAQQFKRIVCRGNGTDLAPGDQ